jgi:aminoglycoside 2''-phosphotransferase
MSDKKSLYLQRIRQRYPDLPVEKIEYLEDAGQFNDVLVLNDEIIFRFPRTQRVAEGLLVEKAILSRIQMAVPLPVPRPAFSSAGEHAVGQVFVGYYRIPGEPLLVETVAAAPLRQRRRLTQQLGGFLKALHDFPPEYIGIDLPEYDSLAYWAQMYAEIQERLFPLMRPDARGQVTLLFEKALSQPDRLAFEPRLRHGDLGPGNILYEPETGKISGIIDFSEAGLGDPAVDLAALSLYGAEFLEDLFAIYPELIGMAERARFYRSTFALQEALAGARDSDPLALERGLNSYR